MFVPSISAANVGNIAAQVTRADGSVHTDDRQGIYYTQASLNACVAGATIPVDGPTPSGGSTATRRSRSAALKRDACSTRGPGYQQCGALCIDTLTSLEHCGGCPGDEWAVDCTNVEHGGDVVECIKGQCVTSGASLPSVSRAAPVQSRAEPPSPPTCAAATWATNPKTAFLRQVRQSFSRRK